MDRFIPIIYIIGWFGAIFAGSYLINWLLIRSIIRRRYRIFVAPGVVVHELSHALGCLATGSQIIEINFWAPGGGHVKHMRPNDPLRRLISDPIIALAPIWGTFLFLAATTYFFMPDLLPLSSFYKPITPNNLLTIFDPTRWQTWLWLYLVTSAVATMAPSKTDIKYALESLLFLTALILAVLFIPGVTGLLLLAIQTLMPLAVFSLMIISFGIFIAFLLAIPNRQKQFIPKNQLE